MNETKKWKLMTIILSALLLFILACCIGAWFGSMVGFGLGRRGAHSGYDYDMPRMIPQPIPSIPSVPTPPLPGVPEIPRLDKTAWLGVTFTTTDRGALIVTVIPGSPAEAAGLQENDVIAEVDGRAVTEMHPLNVHIQRYTPGDMIRLTVLRDGRERTITARLGTQ